MGKKETEMKYIGVNKNKEIRLFQSRPQWVPQWIAWSGNDYFKSGQMRLPDFIPQGVLPPLESCCLYRIDKDCYTLIEDRRK